MSIGKITLEYVQHSILGMLVTNVDDLMRLPGVLKRVFD